jgi:1-acyl-sn-glycerol-3-phosphate acyltransferase
MASQGPDLPGVNKPYYHFCRWAFAKLFKLTGGYEVKGLENIPPTGQLLIAANHTSNLDPPAMGGSCPVRYMRSMAKAELFKGIIGFVLSRVGVFPVRRGEGDTESIRLCLETLEMGGAVLIFPEGTRGDGKTMQPLQMGMAMLAKRTGAPVVPVAIVGTHLAMPRGGKFRRGHKVTVVYGKPFSYSETATGANEKENRKLFNARLAREIVALCAAEGMEVGLPPQAEPTST